MLGTLTDRSHQQASRLQPNPPLARPAVT